MRLVIAVLAGAPVLLAGVLNEVFMGLAALYGLILGAYCLLDCLILPSARQVQVRRIAPERVSLGAATQVVLEVRNSSSRVLRVELAEDLPRPLEAAPAVLSTVLEPGRRVALEYRLTATQRGRHPLGDLFVRILPRGGLLHRQFRVRSQAEIQVFPNLVNLKRYDLMTRKGMSLEGRVRARQIGQGSEFESLRHYVVGDERSRIDWKATAKQARLIVKNYEPERQQSVVVALDLGRATAGRFEPLSRMDYLVNAALMLAYVSLRQKDRFSVLAFSDRIEAYLPPVSGARAVDRVARVLFDLHAKAVESDYGAACRFLGRHNRKRSLLCLLTDVMDRQASAVMIGYMARFARYHLPLVVTLSDPTVHAAAGESLGSCRDVYCKAAALDVLAARREALVTMQRLGVSVLDVLPSQLTVELINRYTLIKTRYQL